MFGSWDNLNLFVEIFDDYVISGFIEINFGIGLMVLIFKVINFVGILVSNFYVDYFDVVILMDFIICEFIKIIVLMGMVIFIIGVLLYKLFVVEVDFLIGIFV